MIGYLSGKVISSKPTHLLLDVNGVGYDISISINTFEKIAEKETVNLFIYTNVKDDSISYMVFTTSPKKKCFNF